MNVSPLNILLAEDERAVASVRLEPAAFNLLITDHSMPGMTGVELVQRLREKSFRGKVMVLSAHLSAENRAAYEALRVDAMVSKPFDVQELRATTRLANGIKLGGGGERGSALADRFAQHAQNSVARRG